MIIERRMHEPSIWERLDDWTAFWRLRMNVKSFVRKWYQRALYGVSDEDTWGIGHDFAKWLLPRLRNFKKLSNGYPSHLTPKEWHAIIDKMIRALEIEIFSQDVDSFIRIGKNSSDSHHRKLWKEADEGYKLIGEYIRALWW